MMDECIVIAAGGRAVGIAVPVRGGFMFFSSEPEFRILEATVLSRAEMFAQRAAEIEQHKSDSGREHAMAARRNRAAAGVDGSGGNVVQLRPTQEPAGGDHDPPDAA